MPPNQAAPPGSIPPCGQTQTCKKITLANSLQTLKIHMIMNIKVLKQHTVILKNIIERHQFQIFLKGPSFSEYLLTY